SLSAAKRLVDNHDDPALGSFSPLTQHMPRRPMDEPGRVHGDGYKWLAALIIVLAAVMPRFLFAGKA
ncbi:hypothetical protein ACSFA2_25775, partial [Variovorax sp. LT2P21]